jgi:tetratricopeptide (TPR) repeat protein
MPRALRVLSVVAAGVVAAAGVALYLRRRFAHEEQWSPEPAGQPAPSASQPHERNGAATTAERPPMPAAPGRQPARTAAEAPTEPPGLMQAAVDGRPPAEHDLEPQTPSEVAFEAAPEPAIGEPAGEPAATGGMLPEGTITAPEPELPTVADEQGGAAAPAEPEALEQAPEAIVEPLGTGAPAESPPAAATEEPGIVAGEAVDEAPHVIVESAEAPAEGRLPDSYLDEGNVYFNVGQFSLAVERYSRALEINPAHAAAYYNRANANTRLGLYSEALDDYDRAVELMPGDADALNNRGMLHLYRSDYEAALADFNAALAIDPQDTTVRVNRGLAHLHSGDAEKAIEDFRAAAEADPGDAAAHYGAAQASAALGDRKQALDYLRAALELDPAYAREAAADPRFASFQGAADFMRLLRETGAR